MDRSAHIKQQWCIAAYMENLFLKEPEREREVCFEVVKNGEIIIYKPVTCLSIL